MDDRTDTNAAASPGPDVHVTPEHARKLLASVPARPRRRLGPRDHLSAAVVIAASLLAGVLALSGHPWWAVAPALVAVVVSNQWIAARRRRTNEPRLGAVTVVTAAFTAWLVLPIYRGIRYGDTAPFPESLILGGLAAAAWLGYYLWLLVRR
jgi:hypothetical protein